MKKLIQFSLAASLATLCLIGCSESGGEAKDPDAPNLKGKPAGPRPSPSVGGGGGPDTKAGAGNQVKVQ